MRFKDLNISDNLMQILYGKLSLTVDDVDRFETEEEKEIAYGLICLAEDLEFNRKKKDAIILNLKSALNETRVFAITDLEGEIKEVNEQFVKLTGYEKGELIGNTLELLDSGYTNRPDGNDMRTAINEGKFWQGEFRYVNKS